jgi:hypothetical protein
LTRNFALWFVTLVSARAHEPITTKLTWTQEISRIFFKRCASCHREGGSAPMTLLAYDGTRPWAKAIREEVLERRMPPWGAVKGFGEFRDDPSLSLPEIEMIVNWVEGGAPKGDDVYLPAPPRPVMPLEPAIPLKQIIIKQERTLSADAVAISIKPQHVPNGGSMEVTAYRPDGGVQHLIWLRNYRPEWNRTYYFREPVRLPKGTRVAVSPATAVISIAKLAR